MNEIDPELYALVHDGVPGDVAYYREQCRRAGRVLELGAGWGRVAQAIAEDGARVTAIELDRGMRELAARRFAELPSEVQGRLTLCDADMAAFELDARFDRVIIPFSGIYCLLDETRLLDCLRCVRRHLNEGGQVLFDAYAADAFHEESRPEDYPDDQLELVAEITHQGAQLAVYERSDWDRDAQRMDAHYHYFDEAEETVHEHTIGHRYLLASQVEPLLEAAGLRLVSLFGGFDGRAYDGTGSLVVVAEAAPEP